MTVHIAIGNSDDRLTQQEWAAFVESVDMLVRSSASVVHGAWLSEAASPWQNAAWGFEPGDAPNMLKVRLSACARDYRQESIAWTEGETEFLPGVHPELIESAAQ